jgi:hypothetical protein
MTNRKNQRKTNGHAEPHDGANVNGEGRPANGHALDSTETDGLSMHTERAASDDAGGLLVAGATPSVAAGANLDAYADAAPAVVLASGPRANGAPPRLPRPKRPKRPNGKDSTDSNDAPEIPPGIEPLPIDGPEFVEAVHERMDLIALQVKLLRSGDEKIVQRELAYLRDLRYGKTVAASAEDEPVQIIFDMPHSDARSKTTE